MIYFFAFSILDHKFHKKKDSTCLFSLLIQLLKQLKQNFNNYFIDNHYQYFRYCLNKYWALFLKYIDNQDNCLIRICCFNCIHG